MTENDFAAVPDVDIDSGVFKYVYIRLVEYCYHALTALWRVYQDAGGDDRNEKDIVRGYNFAEYHADVYDKTESELSSAGLDCECLGGGRIEHRPDKKYIKVEIYFENLFAWLEFPGVRIQHGIRES